MDLNRTTWSCRFLSHKLIGWGPVHETTFAAPRPRVICGLALFVAVQWLIHVWLFATPRTAACQTSFSYTISQSLLKLMSIDSVMVGWTISSSIVPFPSCLQYFPTSMCFPMSWRFRSGGENVGTSASISVLPMNIQSWFPLGVTGLISLLSKRLSCVFSSTTVQKHQFFSAQPSLWSNSNIFTRLLEKTIALTIWTFVDKIISLLFNILSRCVIALLPMSKRF